MSSIQLQIRDNSRKTFLAMAFLTTLIGILGSALSYIFQWGLTGTGWFLIIAGCIDFIAFFFSDRIVLKASGAKQLEKNQAPELFLIIEKLCMQENLPLPKLYLINDTSMNAFATGRNTKHAAIAVTRGIVEKLSEDELTGVIAHELSHIQNNDIRTMAIITVLVGGISLIADMFWYSSFATKSQEKDRSGMIAWIGVGLAIFAPLTAMLIQLFISRKRELIADATAAHMTQKPKALASALQKISMNVIMPTHTSRATAHLYFSSPSRGEALLDKLFSTHPPIEERINLLMNM
jgi:heat shock protein HtpX